ncbi:MAG: FAD-dependent oxidoreductase, partial [Acetobacteraceae bacterium]|nr:FAD-dependent oxidoreductase [Acetobacteraceae bacterium]
MAEPFPHLFSPLRIGAVELPNRVAMSALTSIASVAGAVTDGLLALYRNRARSGLGMIVTEALSSHSRQRPGGRVHAYDEANLPGLQRWAEAVEGAGCRLLGQMMDPGRGFRRAGRHADTIGPSALPDDLSWVVPRPMTLDEIARLVEEFAATARRLQRAGFSGVELSCAHGHLLHQFLSPQANARADRYGGDLDGRALLVRELCAAVRQTCGAKFLLGLKLPGDDGVPGGIGPDLAEQLVRHLAPLADYLAIAQGAHHPRSLHMHVPDRSHPPLPYRDLTRRMRAAAAGTPVLAVGGVATPSEAETLLAEGTAEGVMLGRALLADPAWLPKARADAADRIQLCVAGNTCWATIDGGEPVLCDVNPRLRTDDELEWQPVRAPVRRRVVVVGAGVAGLEAAAIAARRGHEVTLLGASERVGGKCGLHAAIPGCEALARAIAPRERAAREAGVTFRLGRIASVGDVLALAPEAVVLATGSRMRPALAGIDLRTAIADAVWSRPGRRGGRALLYDCDGTAGTYDAAEQLAAIYDEVLLATPRETVARDLPLVTKQRVQARLFACKTIEAIVFVQLAGFAGGTVSLRHVFTLEERPIPDVALLAYATPRVVQDELGDPLRAHGVEVHLAGDCRAPRTLLAALREGHEIANAL